MRSVCSPGLGDSGSGTRGLWFWRAGQVSCPTAWTEAQEDHAEEHRPASAFTLFWLCLRSPGGHWWNHWPKAGSMPSLAEFLLFGSLASLGACHLSQDLRNVWVFLAMSGTLAGTMGMKFYHSGKFMPAGLIAEANLPMVAKVGIGMLDRPHHYASCPWVHLQSSLFSMYSGKKMWRSHVL